ncbi:hypothetical protein [uncultured Victivallis sp.]|uniref:tetratricopeptide repeat protein n=1 Tax=uncultured Victivallis sp. TaxID=354118 RepID=UPI0025F1B4C6|nr:hypothetical protein [uncultured Victivallis sp.]
MKRMTGILCCGVAAALLILAAGCGPNTVDECLNAGAAYGANGDWKKALKMAERAESLSENSVPALVLRAIAHEKLGERDLALDAARQAATLNPESFVAQYTLGRLYAADPTRYSDALAPLTRAAKLRNFRDRNTLILLANTTAALRSPSAGNWLNFLVRVAPEIGSDPAYRNLLGIVLTRARKLDSARQEFTQAYQQDRSNPMVVYNIGVFFDRYAANPRAGRQFYQAFLRLAGDDPQYADLKSRVSAQLTQMR